MLQTGTLTSLFQELVHAAMEGQRIASSETTECYLVFLLERFTRPGRTDLLDPPLGVDYLRAFEQDAAQRFDTLRRVADTALFVTGVFAESLDRSLVGTPYYTALGRNAYAHLSAHIGRGDLAAAFVELADRFPEFVAVLSAIGSCRTEQARCHRVRPGTRPSSAGPAGEPRVWPRSDPRSGRRRAGRRRAPLR